jgi:hypothetical protein
MLLTVIIIIIGLDGGFIKITIQAKSKKKKAYSVFGLGKNLCLFT